ncbi:MAG: hypothetical protein D6748_03400 [Calditrichaeota bacterium]|nr:MAG: hypothetical protein D6748_03400 [Calditrichota bacterium]
MNRGRVFYAVLNMGLGHASRSLSIIQEFLRRGWEVLIGSNGRALEFLKKEFPGIPYVVTPGYDLKYSESSHQVLTLSLQIPHFLKKIFEEQQFCQQVVREYEPSLIVSDHCYGMYHHQVPSYFLSHQIYFALPRGLSYFSAIPSQFNFYFHRKYRKVLIPDYADGKGGVLSGALSRVPKKSSRYAYIGLLSSISRKDAPDEIDILVSISGPEPQRSIFEQKILSQISSLNGKIIVTLGKSEIDKRETVGENITIYSHLPRRMMGEVYNRARFIISRSGYSTLMELAELGKPALLVPTPGQTEQEYLARWVWERQWFYSVSQQKLNLERDLETAVQYAGLFKPDATDETVERFFEEI